MRKLRLIKVGAAFLIVIVGRTAYSKDEKPSTYQQAFDKAVAKVNDDLGIYGRLNCATTSFQFVSDTLKADLAKFSTLFAKVPNDKEFIRNTEIGLGVNEFANFIMQRQAKSCMPNGVDPLTQYNLPLPQDNLPLPQAPSQPSPPVSPTAPNHFPPPSH